MKPGSKSNWPGHTAVNTATFANMATEIKLNEPNETITARPKNCARALDWPRSAPPFYTIRQEVWERKHNHEHLSSFLFLNDIAPHNLPIFSVQGNCALPARECGGQSISDDFAGITAISTVHTICSKGLLVSKHSQCHFDESEE